MCQEIPRAIQLSPNASSNACSTPTRPLWRCYNKLEGPVQRPCTEVSLTQGNTQSSPLRSRICPGIKSTMEQILTYLLHWWRHCTWCLQCKTDVTCTFFSTNKVTSPALIFIGADLKSTNSPQRFFHLKNQFTAQASKLTKNMVFFPMANSTPTRYLVHSFPHDFCLQHWWSPCPTVQRFNSKYKCEIHRLSYSVLGDFLTVSARKYCKIHSVQGLKTLLALFWELRKEIKMNRNIKYKSFQMKCFIVNTHTNDSKTI